MGALRKILAVALVWSAAFAVASVPSRAQEAPRTGRVMIVLDASGSMWGQVAGKAKIVIAREVIRDLMTDWDPSLELGLSAYGHRVKGDCTDIETLIPVARTDPRAVVRAVDAIQPKGKTPLSEAVRRAAEELRYTEEVATVILVSDGRETCEADPCAVGRALAEAGVGFTAHVIGFDVASDQQQGLRCLAESTGGQFFAAEDATSLRDALGETVQLAMDQQPKQPDEPKVTGLRFRLLYAEGGPQVESGVEWSVYEAEADIEGNRSKAAFSYDPEPAFELPPGRYLVVAEVGAARARVELEVGADGRGAHDVVLDAGLARLSAKRTPGSEPVGDGLDWEVYEAEATIDGDRRKVAFSYDGTPLWTLPAGRYLITVARGAARGSTEIEVRAGKRSEAEVVLSSGIARLRAVLEAGGEAVAGGLEWDVLEAEETIEGQRRKVAFSYDNEPQWELPEGRYLVSVRRGAAVARAEIAVTAGRRTEAAVVLDAGVLRVEADGGPGGRIEWDVYEAETDIEGRRKKVAFSYDREPSWTIPAGRYLVTAVRGSARGEAELEIGAGETRKIVVGVE